MAITVFLADDNLIVREGVKALLELEDDLDVVGQGADYDELVAGAELDAARAEAEAERMLRLAAQNRADALETANRKFSERVAEAELENGNLDDQIAELLARPVSATCVVDDGLLERLRNR